MSPRTLLEGFRLTGGLGGLGLSETGRMAVGKRRYRCDEDEVWLGPDLYGLAFLGRGVGGGTYLGGKRKMARAGEE